MTPLKKQLEQLELERPHPLLPWNLLILKGEQPSQYSFLTVLQSYS